MPAPRTQWALTAFRAAAGILPVVAPLLCLSIGMVRPALADDLDAVCQQTGPDKRRLECDLRFYTPATITSVTARVMETSRSLPTPSNDRYPKGDDLSAFLFLFNLSDPGRAGTVSANAADALRILKTAAPNDRFGIATLPGSGRGPEPSLDVPAQIGTDLYNVEKRLAEMKAKGSAPPVYKSSIEGIRLLKDFPAKRRALLLFSDGKSEDKSNTLDNVIEEAQKQHVPVFAFGVAERGADLPSLQPLKRLGDGTKGSYFQADLPNRHFSGPTLDSVLKYVDNGGRVEVDLSGIASDQTVELVLATTGVPQSVIHRVKVQGLAAEPSPPEAAPPGWFERLSTWISAHKIETALAAFAVLLLLFALVMWLYRAARRRRQDIDQVAPSEEETYRFRAGGAATAQPDDSPSVSLATLQPVRSGGSPHVVRAPMVTIGRASDCDIRLNDETISAHHATLVRKRDGSFELTDMGSRNGVRVNGERVDRRRVSDGDRIELGGAQFRFVLN